MPASGSPPDASLEADTRRAEELLFDLAAELQRTPLASAIHLHISALQVKRAIGRWRDEPPSEPSRRATLDEILALQESAQTLRRHTEWSHKIAI